MRVAGHRIGRIVDVREGNPVIDYPGNPHGPLVARAAWPPASPKTLANRKGAEALLVFDDERSDRPIVVGLMSAVPRETAPANSEPRTDAFEAVVDGRRVVLDAAEEIVLRCGQASITLRKNGRVVIRGAYVETRSRGVNRIKGGSVQIN
jgi:hypothetical protein